ncbi:MAG TPA: SOS response-associated peptidase [Solirubrobacteraceae bacterium]|nr:SOS response-associated peptidase [Solirubrobacteraceae bacterium]
MCGRYTATQVNPALIADRFGVREQAVPGETLGRFNVCPTEPVLAVCAPGEARALRWGLIPPWARALRAGPEPINARAESLRDKRLFAPLIGAAAHRCLVVADGWYEWLRPETPKGQRVPFRYTVDGGELFAFAGLWREGRAGGERIASVTVLTTAANAVCAPVHDRMPCVLPGAEAEAAWLSPDVDADGALDLLAPLDAARTAAAPANPAVNKAGVEGPDLLLAPPASAPAQLTL